MGSATQLGPYEVLALLGSGGMGEVYHAHDPRLGRDVALKVLPEEVSRDRERLARFDREARALAAISHPNILDVHDVGSQDGTVYIVSELLQGETLRNRLGRGHLGRGEAIDYGIQIARGLAVAHGKGIVHRDLKPANVFLTRDRRVKILDFGLAKLTRPQPRADHTAPTTTVEAETDPGTVLGTVAYMSPEQLRGRAVDHRSDVFSFGAVLYEMLTGDPPFRGHTAVETASAILSAEPPEPTGTERDLPAPLRRIVRRSLEKEPERRFQSLEDLAFSLEAVRIGRDRPAMKRGFGLLAAGIVGATVALAASLLELRDLQDSKWP